MRKMDDTEKRKRRLGEYLARELAIKYPNIEFFEDDLYIMLRDYKA